MLCLVCVLATLTTLTMTTMVMTSHTDNFNQPLFTQHIETAMATTKAAAAAAQDAICLELLVCFVIYYVIFITLAPFLGPLDRLKWQWQKQKLRQQQQQFKT